MKIIMEKTGFTARLFCLVAGGLVFSTFTRADDPPAPEAWISEAKGDREWMQEHRTVPQYELQLISRIREKIIAQEADAEFQNYTGTIGDEKVPYEMLAIEGGTFLMGSPPDEEGRNEDEGPQREVTVSPFWMGKSEVTWSQYMLFADRKKEQVRNKNGTPRSPDKMTADFDWVTAPTEYYMAPDLGMGMDDGFPAVGMTQHAANKFCQWLSALTGHYYRLPTEAEWEYACRAGTTGPFSCAAEELDAHAVLDPEQRRVRYEKVRTKKPNPWGLHDMHGNVFEWCLDGYSKDGYDGLPLADPWKRAEGRYPRIVRGGSWYDDDPAYLRSAARVYSDSNWNIQDPQLPQSLWWLVDAQWVGFRVVRPTKVPNAFELFEVWNTGAIHKGEDEE